MLYKPLKKFGQNYLTDENILKKIYQEISPLPSDNILEIGPGYGALTKYFTSHPNYIGVEIDSRTYSVLCQNFPYLNFINEDFLKTNISKLFSNNDIYSSFEPPNGGPTFVNGN